MSLKVHIQSACTAMPFKLTGCCTSDRILTNYSANKFVLTGVHLDKKQYTGKTI